MESIPVLLSIFGFSPCFFFSSDFSSVFPLVLYLVVAVVKGAGAVFWSVRALEGMEVACPTWTQKYISLRKIYQSHGA